jgi:hypothetical protein
MRCSQPSKVPGVYVDSEVLGVVLVAGEAVGEAVDAAAVRADDLLPGGRSPRLPVRVGGEGRGLGVVADVAVVSSVVHGFRPARRSEEAPQHSSPIPVGRGRTSPVSSGGVQWSPYHSHLAR